MLIWLAARLLGMSGSNANPFNQTVRTHTILLYSFSRMRSKGSRFTLEVWGVRLCLLDVAFVSSSPPRLLFIVHPQLFVLLPLPARLHVLWLGWNELLRTYHFSVKHKRFIMFSSCVENTWKVKMALWPKRKDPLVTKRCPMATPFWLKPRMARG